MATDDEYREIRVLIQKGKNRWYVAVLARRKSRGIGASDRLVTRLTMPAEPDATAAEVVEAAADALHRAADSL